MATTVPAHHIISVSSPSKYNKDDIVYLQGLGIDIHNFAYTNTDGRFTTKRDAGTGEHSVQPLTAALIDACYLAGQRIFYIGFTLVHLELWTYTDVYTELGKSVRAFVDYLDSKGYSDAYVGFYMGSAASGDYVLGLGTDEIITLLRDGYTFTQQGDFSEACRLSAKTAITDPYWARVLWMITGEDTNVNYTLTNDAQSLWVHHTDVSEPEDAFNLCYNHVLTKMGESTFLAKWKMFKKFTYTDTGIVEGVVGSRRLTALGKRIFEISESQTGEYKFTAHKKKYLVKVYTPNPTFIKQVDCDIESFKMSINGGQGDMSILLPYNFTNFKQSEVVKLNLVYYVYCVDVDTDPSGKLIYVGQVNSWEVQVGQTSKVKVNLSGHWNRLAQTVLKSSTTIKLMTATATGLKTSGAAEATEISDVVDEIMDRFAAEVTFPFPQKGTIEATGQNMTYTFLGSTYYDAIKKCREFAPANWWFYVGAYIDGAYLQFKSKPTEPTHLFTFKKDISELNLKFSMDGIVNRYILGNNVDLQKLFKDTTSSGKFGDIWQIETDERITDSGTLDNKGNAKIAELKDEQVILTFTVFDNNFNASGYDIESILPGNSCKILGIDPENQVILSDNMLIISVDYHKTYAIIEVQTPRENVGEIVRNLANRTSYIEQDSLLATYTE